MSLNNVILNHDSFVKNQTMPIRDVLIFNQEGLTLLLWKNEINVYYLATQLINDLSEY